MLNLMVCHLGQVKKMIDTAILRLFLVGRKNLYCIGNPD
jgi:hypothetical protein